MDSRKAVCELRVDGLGKVLHFEDGLLRVPHQPEDDGIDIDGHSVAGECRLGADRGDAHALIDVAAERLDDRNDEEEAGAAQAAIAAKAQHGDLLPLVDHNNGK